MISTQLLKEALQEDFSYSIKSQGKNIHEDKAVINLYVTDKKIKAAVLDKGTSLNILFTLTTTDDYIDFEGQCNCSTPNCKHQAAVLYTAITQIKEGKISLRKSSPKKENKKVTTPPPLHNQLEGNHAGEFRRLPINTTLREAISQFQPNHYSTLTWNETFKGCFISPDEIELENDFNEHYYHRIEKKKIRILFEDRELFVSCLICKGKAKKLCAHQMALLQGAQSVLASIDFKKENYYERVLKIGVKKTGHPVDVLLKYFNLEILPTGFSYFPKKDNMMNDRWFQATQELSQRAKKQRQEIVQRTTETLEINTTDKYGFFWAKTSNHSDEPNVKLFFVKGNGYKNKEGIRDANKTTESMPKGFPSKQQKLGQELFFLCQEKNPQLRFESIKNLIEQNLEDLHDIYQYTYNGNPYPYAPRVSELNLVEFDPVELECKIDFEVIDGLTHMTRHILHEGEPFDYKKIIYSNEVFCSTGTTAYLHPHHRFHDFMQVFINNHDTIILPSLDKKQQTELVSQFKDNFDVTIPPDLILEEEILQNPQFQILLREAGNFVIFEPRLKYGEHSFNAFEEDSYFIGDLLFRVDEEDRKFLIDFLKNTHPDFDLPIQVQEYVYLDVKEMINNYWFIHFNEACEVAGIEVLGQKELTKFKYSKHRAQTYMHIKSGIDWFDVEAGISFGKENVKAADWIRALRNKESFVTLKDGSLGVLPEEWLKQAAKVLAVANVEKGELKISKYRFNIIEDLFENIDDKEIIKELKAKKARIAKLDTNKTYELPGIITATLRDYQRHGFEWLKFLDESGFGGILADDMGLGKTLQVITLLADQIDSAPSLVVVPRSLLFNWAAELDKFCGNLKYEIHHGAGRAKTMEAMLPLNIIITTYHTAANDIQIFKDFKFNYIILDESQAIKNPDSKRYKAMRLLKAKNRLAMTGTPIENNTFDLYAQLSFTSPGLLGSPTHFKQNFSVPIDSQGDVEAAGLLRKLIHPFILRRTKQQVAKDLPEKTETIIYCEMGTAQRKLYDNLKRKIREDIEMAVEEKGVAKSKFQMLDGLLRLRQMCNSPLLINPHFTGSNADSVKINTIVESLTEALDQKHNALVFSQFTSLLAIVRTELDKRGIRYAYLDGSTTKRQAQVDKFMDNDEVSIFLISIKAGNTGMNLTKADYVYILDPWWNPAVEAQAIDRTHRIGQKNQIFAYKLICKNSIEEKILKLQDKKKKLAQDIIRTDENVLKSLDKVELMALFD